MTAKKPKPPHVWVVELLYEHNNRWEPCVGIALERESARAKVDEWRANNPGGKFRIRKYVRAEK